MTTHSSGVCGWFASRLEKLLCRGRKSFYAAVLVTLAAALAPCYALYNMMSDRVAYQAQRNDYLNAEIAKLDSTIAEINQLKDKTRRVLARQSAVEHLHNSRSTDVKLFNFLARGVPPGVRLIHAEFSHNRLALDGLTPSAEGVQELMRNIGNSPYLDSPALIYSSAQGPEDDRVQQFRMEAAVVESGQPPADKSRSPASPAPQSASQPGPAPARADSAAAPSPEPTDLSGWMLPGVGLLALSAAGIVFWLWRRRRARSGAPRASCLARAGGQFAALDAKDLSTWGLVPRLAVLLELFVLAVFAAWLFVFDAQWDEYSTAVDVEEKLKTKLLDKKRVAVNIDLIKRQLQETLHTFGPVVQRIPTHYDAGELSVALENTARRHGVSIAQIEPETEVVRGPLVQSPVHIALTGTFDGIGAFVAEAAKMEPMLNIPRFSLAPDEGVASQGRNMKLRFEGELMSYRYRDEAEPATRGRAGTEGAGK